MNNLKSDARVGEVRLCEDQVKRLALHQKKISRDVQGSLCMSLIHHCNTTAIVAQNTERHQSIDHGWKDGRKLTVT